MTRLAALLFGLSIAIGPSVALGWAAEAAAASRAEVKRIVVEESLRAGFPPSLAMAVAKAESNFNDRAVSHAGARGVMQVMPRTAREVFGVHPDELWDARRNVQLGIDFLESLIRRYRGRWDIALSHYKGGSGVGDPENPEVIPATQAYVDRVLRLHRRYNGEAKTWFTALRNGEGPAARIRKPYDRGAERRAHAGKSDTDFDQDFAGGIEARRQQARRHLDDFAPMMLDPGS